MEQLIDSGGRAKVIFLNVRNSDIKSWPLFCGHLSAQKGVNLSITIYLAYS